MKKSEVVKINGKKVLLTDFGVLVFDKYGNKEYNVAMIPYSKLTGQKRMAYHALLVKANVDDFTFLGYTYDDNGRKYCFYDMTLSSQEERRIINHLRKSHLVEVIDVKRLEKEKREKRRRR